MSEPRKIIPLRQDAPADMVARLEKLEDSFLAGLQEIRAVKAELKKQQEVGTIGNGERLLDPAEAAKLLSVSEEYLYRRANKLPFTRKLGPRLLRFSYVGLMKWIEGKKFDRA